MRLPPADDALHGIQLPLRLRDGSHAVVREISAAGLYMESDSACRVAARIELEVHLPGTHMKFLAQGVVVRVERAGRRHGVHVRFTSLQMHLPD